MSEIPGSRETEEKSKISKMKDHERVVLEAEFGDPNEPKAEGDDPLKDAKKLQEYDEAEAKKENDEAEASRTQYRIRKSMQGPK